jgi:hypothetical protein
LIFQINNRLQAIDARTGKSILTFGKNGLVDLREVNGRQFLVVCATNPLTWGRETRAGSGALGDDGASDLQRAYIAFALPVKAERKEWATVADPYLLTRPDAPPKWFHGRDPAR